MKILIIQNKPLIEISQKHLKLIKKVYPNAQISVADSNTARKHLKAAEIVISLNNFLDQLKRARSLRWIHVTSAGADDLPEFLKTSDILITNSSGVHPIPIAEHVFAFILMFVRQIHVIYRSQIEDKRWVRDWDELFPKISEIHGTTIGIVGFGRIGKRVAQLAKAFGMTVISVSRQDKRRRHDLKILLGQSDFVVNCLPSTLETHHYFGSKDFKAMKKSAYFINIGRGETVNEKDLIRALKTGTIAGAGLDVFEREPLPPSSELWKFNNVILTPHYAGWTPYYTDRVIAIFCENLKQYVRKKAMPNLVDKKRGY